MITLSFGETLAKFQIQITITTPKSSSYVITNEFVITIIIITVKPLTSQFKIN